ncbi:MAG: hypothetical protein IPJ65_42505 [Archangiaceae bacterium]|nr:hypothetical protein [Archangiaceae bacterium]
MRERRHLRRRHRGRAGRRRRGGRDRGRRRDRRWSDGRRCRRRHDCRRERRWQRRRSGRWTAGGGAAGGGTAGGTSGAGGGGGIAWRALSGTFATGRQPQLHLTDCGAGRACFCATSSDGGVSFGNATSGAAVNQYAAAGLGSCAGVVYVAPNAVMITELGNSQVTRSTFAPTDTTVRDGGRRAVTDFAATGAVAAGLPDGGFGVLATGTTGAASDFTTWLDPVSGYSGFSPDGCSGSLVPFAPVAMVDGGALLPYLAESCVHPVGVTRIDGLTSVAPYSLVSLAHTPKSTTRVSIAATRQLLWVAFEFGAGLEVQTFDVQGGSYLTDFSRTPSYNAFVGLLPLDDTHVYAVMSGTNSVLVDRLSSDAGNSLSTFAGPAPEVVTAVLLSNNTLVLAGVCTAMNALCSQPGQGLIGFLPAP